MLAWSFAARTAEEVASLLRALGRHRYLREASYALHWSVDEALASVPAFAPIFAPAASAFRVRREHERELDPSSRDPSLWRQITLDELLAVLTAFWSPGEDANEARARLAEVLQAAELSLGDHQPFAADPEEVPHPELVLVDWELLAIDALDSERHAGALAALELAGEEVDVSAPVYAEPSALAYPELALGAPNGVLVADFWVWCDGDYSYVDYVFRGVARAAKLVDPPVGPRDVA
jgi:hypothetical protein